MNKGDLVRGMYSVDNLLAKYCVLDLLEIDCFFNVWLCHSLMFSTTLCLHIYLFKYLIAVLTKTVLFF